jgi:hypothetical protein
MSGRADALLMLRLDGSTQLIVTPMVFGLNAPCERIGARSVAITCASIVHGDTQSFRLLSLMLGFLRPHGSHLL